MVFVGGGGAAGREDSFQQFVSFRLDGARMFPFKKFTDIYEDLYLGITVYEMNDYKWSDGNPFCRK